MNEIRSIEGKNNLIMLPDIKIICERIAKGVYSDIDNDYKDIESLYFDLVVMTSQDNRLNAIVLDNKYKLSKTIVDTDEGREAVVIPLRFSPLRLSKYRIIVGKERYDRLYRDIIIRVSSLYLKNGAGIYIAKNKTHINKLIQLYTERYDIEIKRLLNK